MSLFILKNEQSASPRDGRKKLEVSRTFRSATKQLGTFFLLNGSQNFNFFILNILNDLDIDSYRFRPCESNAVVGFTISSILNELERVKNGQNRFFALKSRKFGQNEYVLRQIDSTQRDLFKNGQLFTLGPIDFLL